MALHYNLSKIENHTELLDEENMPCPRTKGVIMSCMTLGLNGMETDDDVDEFIIRSRYWNTLHPINIGGCQENFENLVRRMRGLTTNVPTETRTEWVERIGEGMLRSLAYDYRRQQEDAA